MSINNRNQTSTPRFSRATIDELDASARENGWTVTPWGALYRIYERAGVTLKVWFSARGSVSSSTIQRAGEGVRGHTWAGKYATSNRREAVLATLAEGCGE